MEIGKRIRQLRKAKKMTILELATSIGSDVGNISRLETGKQGYSDATIKKIAHTLGVNVSDLFTEEEIIMPQYKDIVADSYRVEVLDLTVSAGPGHYMLSEVVEVLNAIEFTSDHARSLFGARSDNDIKVMTVDGDSMYPTIKSGDRLFFDVSVREFKTDGVYAFVYGKTFHVKRLQMQGVRLAVLSDNPNLEKWYIEEETEDQFYVMGKALIHESIMYGRL
ncbi:XRE family transcriptional regulator [Pectobacterium versatile]|uniref:XRE family transcriptional regulator n=1 Tax=Pectobacterium versatile TaxID=2488639 RepID=UPI001B38C38A|nr:helix-turn-helix domain-containing protein [Pectobacterium versatile]